MHARDDDVERREQVEVLVEAAVLEDVDLDAGEDAERRELLVELGDDVELLAQPVGVEAVRHAHLGRVVREREVLVAELGRLARHRLDRRAAVGPVGVQVEVPTERGADRRAGPGVGRGLGLEPGEVLGHLSCQRLLDHAGGAVADAGQVLQAALGRRGRAARFSGRSRTASAARRNASSL